LTQKFTPSLPRQQTSTEIVQQLLEQHTMTTMPISREVALRGRLDALDRQAPELEQAAKRYDVDIEHLGIAALPEGPMLYNGADGTGWVMGPATKPEDTIVPKQQGEELRVIRNDAGIYFPRIYVAHELRPEQAERLRGQVTGGGLQLEAAEAAELVGPNPQPPEALARGEQMAHRSQQIVNGLQTAGKVVVGVVVGAVVIPVAAAAAVLAAPVAMVDPIILGAIPAGSESPGEPASWYRLVAWDW
jgi:hypothetical protein